MPIDRHGLGSKWVRTEMGQELYVNTKVARGKWERRKDLQRLFVVDIQKKIGVASLVIKLNTTLAHQLH